MSRLTFSSFPLEFRGVDSDNDLGAVALSERDDGAREEEAAVLVGGAFGAGAGVDAPKENLGADDAPEVALEGANEIFPKGFGLEDDSFPPSLEACDVDIAVGCAKVVEAKGLEEEVTFFWDAVGILGAAAEGSPVPPPNFRLDTLTIFRF